MLFALIALAAINFSVIAQSSQYSSSGDYVAVVAASIPGDELPPQISHSVNLRFDKNNPLTWSKFPYKINDFGWVYEVGPQEDKLSRYEVTMRTSSGGYFYGYYNAEGDLVETMERSKDIPVPRYIMVALYETPYRDWKIVGNREVVNFYQNTSDPVAEQHFKLIVEKDNKRKRLAFNYDVNTGNLQAMVIR